MNGFKIPFQFTMNPRAAASNGLGLKVRPFQMVNHWTCTTITVLKFHLAKFVLPYRLLRLNPVEHDDVVVESLLQNN